MIHWSSLTLLDPDMQEIGDGATRMSCLAEYRATGSMYTVFFERIGAPHEDAEDPSTWGPQSPDGVDWTGFGD